MTTILTLCSANYLAHAKTLGDSVLQHNPGFHFVIGLVDRWPQKLERSYCEKFEVIEVERLSPPRFSDMTQKYNLVELNTAVKPFYMEFLFERDQECDAIIYLDPDILVYGSFDALLRKLRTVNIVVTPHSCTYDDSDASLRIEKSMLSNGIYNLGFIAMFRTVETARFIRWWKSRLMEHCYYRPGVAGCFFDQLWINLAPLYFRDVLVETDPGCNISHWNHFERNIELKDGRYIVNGSHDLVFFHFSGYNPDTPELCLGRSAKPIPFSDRQTLRPIYDDYRSRLLERDHANIRAMPWFFRPQELPRPQTSVMFFFKRGLKRLFSSLSDPIRRRLKRLARFTLQNC
jgi:hypothetical protein